MSRDAPIVVVGATGVVGHEALRILESRGVPCSRIRALASGRTAGGSIPFAGATLRIELAEPEAFRGASLALFCASAEVSRALVPAALAGGAVVVDNSSAFRLHPDVPLVVPEINGDLIAGSPECPRLIANPNCSTVILLLALEPLRRAFGVTSIHVATYQAVSGAGQGGIDDLLAQLSAIRAGRTVSPRFFREPCALNVFSHDSEVDARTGLNGEERKIIEESRKIWADPSLRVTPTCVRVPVLRAHTQAITVELSASASEDEVRSALAGGQVLKIIDDRGGNNFPTPLKASGQDEILVGRIRPDPADEPTARGKHRRWCLMACGDQLRKGAAGNAIQIADLAGLLAFTGADRAPQTACAER